jgi:hypothetical protein
MSLAGDLPQARATTSYSGADRGHTADGVPCTTWPTGAKVTKEPEVERPSRMTGSPAGYRFEGDCRGDPEHLARLGHGVDEALFGFLECAVVGRHERHCQGGRPVDVPWTSRSTGGSRPSRS